MCFEWDFYESSTCESTTSTMHIIKLLKYFNVAVHFKAMMIYCTETMPECFFYRCLLCQGSTFVNTVYHDQWCLSALSGTVTNGACLLCQASLPMVLVCSVRAGLLLIQCTMTNGSHCSYLLLLSRLWEWINNSRSGSRRQLFIVSVASSYGKLKY